MRGGIRRRVIAVVVSGAVTLAIGTGDLAAGQVPILAGPWGPNQKGYGHIKPNTIYNGATPPAWSRTFIGTHGAAGGPPDGARAFGFAGISPWWMATLRKERRSFCSIVVAAGAARRTTRS